MKLSEDKQQYDLKIREIDLPEKVQKTLRKNMDSTGSKTPVEDPFTNYYDRKIIEPPHDLYLLSTLREYSTILGPCVDAMTVNISGLGYRIVPRDEKETNDVADDIKTDIAKLKTFYETVYLEGTFTQLRKLLRRDLEDTGNYFIEVLPSIGDAMVPVGMKHMPAWNMRVCVADTEWTTYMVPRVVKTESGKWEIRQIPDRKQFRRYAHKTQYSNKITYFKEWGDPRVISYQSGDVIAESWEQATPEQRVLSANPVIHQKIYCPRSPYGLPRYIGNILTMNGCRAAEEVNYITLKCNNMPAMMLLVTNAAITNASIDRIREFIEHRIQGDQNYSTILVVEAEPVSEGMKDPGTMKMDLNPLTEHQHSDAMFTQYMEGCEERVRQAYRLPPILIGRCVPIETEFLTEKGWKLYSDISDDEKIGTFNLESEEIEYQVPLKRYEYDYKGEMYKFSDCWGELEFDCTPNHKMVYIDDDDNFKISLASQLPKEFAIPIYDPIDNKYDRYSYWHNHLDYSDISKYDYDGKICCFTTPNGTIITRKNSDSLNVISHNSDDYTRSCYSEDTETLTENGWKYHWDIFDDEQIVAFDYDLMEPKLVVPSDKHLSYVDDYMYHIHTDYTDCLVTGEHKILLGNVETGDVYIETEAKLLISEIESAGFQVGIWSLDNYDEPVLEPITINDITAEYYKGDVYCYSVPEYGYFITRRNGKCALQGNTADSSKKVAEEQVFAPEREDEDDLQNIKIVPYLGIVHAVIRSNTPDVTDNYELTQLLAVAERSGGLSPYISRFIVEDVLGRDLPEIDETIPNNIPFTLTMLREQLNAQAAMQGISDSEKLLSDKEIISQLSSIKNLMVENNVGTEEYYRRMDKVIKLMEMTQIEIPKVEIQPKKKESDQIDKIIREEDGQYCVYSEDGSRSFGCYDTREEAEERLDQIHWFSEKSTILRKAGEERIVVGAVLVPGQTDLQGEIYDADVVTKAAHYWLEKYQEDRQENGLKLMHSGQVLTTLKPYESYVLDEDKTFKIDISIANDNHPVNKISEITYPKGTWIMMAKIYDDDIWSGIKNGDYLGYSIGGMASVVEIKKL